MRCIEGRIIRVRLDWAYFMLEVQGYMRDLYPAILRDISYEWSYHLEVCPSCSTRGSELWQKGIP